ncbi:sulfurtransferase [Verminephrobacter aporrectodeae subsp. tuberculatae]|uniref:rhodanese-like domain-containing protein n=1 Tax=Verminephrobacter aporrectodeae TaxID=1110389 RepID=UPI002238FEFE|nr:rhodanese-like domain-containing protein [Verminephrobacter aporrectodeae]MCW5222180.1 sulfurtransferase [Verminephrobacter aporrectodeae subsp. tuberculatae]MCW5287644.1 sulfurtransferase [Verminephrobacter aporrectodeae subsp. tuberculatae]
MSSAAHDPRPALAPGVTPNQLQDWLHDGQEIALLDVREHGQYGEGHLFHAVPLPWSRLEWDLPRLVPCRHARVVVYDDGPGDVAGKAWQRLHDLGYHAGFVLAGGAAAWAACGQRIFQGVHLPSKTFGELVEQRLHTPSISATELARRQAAGDRLLLLDGRSPAEFRKMNVPGALNCPNGELALRIGDLAPDPETTVVISCAGRTRSIIGAQTLINLGLPNPVLALENGTQGWFLAGLELEHGQQRCHAPGLPADLALRQRQASALGRRHGVQWIGSAQAQAWVDDARRSTFVLDVRTGEEFAQGSIQGAQHAPGGQLVQATDQFVGVRSARLLLLDSEGVRAPVVASWLRQMGIDAHVLQDGVAAALRLPPPLQPALPAVPTQTADALAAALASASASTCVIDLRPSMAYRRAHVPGALWSIRPRLSEALASAGVAADASITLVADEPAIARLVAQDLMARGQPCPQLLAGGVEAWERAGHALESSPETPGDAQCIDYLFFVHDRHDGNQDAARRYLAWETGLVAQLDARELAAYRIA